MNRSRSSHLLLLGCASLLLGACVQSGSGGGSTLNLEQQVQQHDMQLRQLQPAQALITVPMTCGAVMAFHLSGSS